MLLKERLSPVEKLALRTVQTAEGRFWKFRLRVMWEKAHYPGYDEHASTLQFLRNCSYFGSSGLIRVRPTDLE